MDLDALRVFVAVAEAASFSAAGEKLGMPKWAVSRSISGLEGKAGVPLLHRTTRRVMLSPAGAALYTRVAPLLSSLDVTTGEWQEESGTPTGEVHISIPSFFYSTLIGRVLGEFTEKYPSVQVGIHLSDVVSTFSLGGFDLAVFAGAEDALDTSLVARRGWKIAGQFFATPAYLARRGVPHSVNDFANHDLISFRDTGSFPIDGPDGREVVVFKSRIRTNDILFVREAVRSDLGIGMLPTFLVQKEVAAGQLVPVLTNYRTPEAHAYIIRPNTREVPFRIRALSDFLYEYMKTHPLEA